MLRRWGLISGSISFLFLAATRTGADDTHYRTIPIGAHAIGLGGAFAGVADDVSAAYFNPAGLAQSGTVGIAGGLSINAWQRFELDRALAQPEQALDATTKTGRTLPIFIGAAVKFGARDDDGQSKNTLAISVLEPIFSNLGAFLKQPGDPLELSDSYQFNGADRAQWYGISYARQINSRHALGTSLYLSVRRLNHSEVGLSVIGGMPLPSDPGAFEGTNTSANHQALGFRTFHLVPRVGWLYRIKPEVQLGVLLQLPGIPVKQRADVFSQGFVNDNRDPTVPTTTVAYYFDERVKAKLPIPVELEAGVEYLVTEKIMLALDASFHSPVPSSNRVELSEPVPVGGLFFDNDTKRLATGNAALAGDFNINQKISIETAFLTDMSSAQRIPVDPDRYYNPRIHHYGAALTMRLSVGGVSLGVGATFLYGRGDATGVTVDRANIAVDYTKTEASSRIIYLHLTGATKAAVDLGTKAQQGIQEKIEKKRAEGDIE